MNKMESIRTKTERTKVKIERKNESGLYEIEENMC